MAQFKVYSEIAGTVWTVEVEPGAAVQEDDAIIVLESMKMEIPIDAPASGKVTKIHVAKGDVVAEGEEVAIIES